MTHGVGTGPGVEGEMGRRQASLLEQDPSLTNPEGSEPESLTHFPPFRLQQDLLVHLIGLPTVGWKFTKLKWNGNLGTV